MFIRYPGSKDKIKGLVLNLFPVEVLYSLWATDGCLHYCEPFFGSGAIGWTVLRSLPRAASVLVNDADPGIAALWRVVHSDHLSLVDKVRRFEPTVEAFNTFKAEDGRTDLDPAEQAFRKLALHQLSFSGLGYMAGGPIGGQGQRSEYNVDCRWHAERLVAGIVECHRRANRYRKFHVSNTDFSVALAKVPPYPNSFVYLDPPYYVQGGALYRYSFTDDDHRRLADALRAAKFRWLLSYDDHPRIRELYSWATIDGFEMTPSVQASRDKAKRRKNNEVLVRNFA